MSFTLTNMFSNMIAPIFNSTSNTQGYHTDFFLPEERETVIQPGQAKSIFSGVQLSQLPSGMGLQLIQTPQNLNNGLRLIHKTITGVGSQISGVLKNQGLKRFVMKKSHHLFKGLLKQIGQIAPLIVLASQKPKNKYQSFKTKRINKCSKFRAR